MKQFLPILARLALGFSLTTLWFAAPGSAQTITNLPDTQVTPSGRLRIQGDGFGTSGTVPQWVLSVPKPLRLAMAMDADLCRDAQACAHPGRLRFLRAAHEDSVRA